jgi:hypothetical protein
MFYETRDEPSFRALRFASARVHPGRAMIYVEARAPHLVGHLRLDLVPVAAAREREAAATTIALRSIEARTQS